MRYFRIVVSDPKNGAVFVPNLNGKPGFSRVGADSNLSTYTSLVSGASVYTLNGTNPAAQNVTLDIPVSVQHLPGSTSSPYIAVHNISLGEIAQASNLNFMNIAIYGGMAKGLPLANPKQAGLLTIGQVRQCLGNWIGTEQVLSFYIGTVTSPSSNQSTGHPTTTSTTPLPASNARPANIVFKWVQGQPLISAISNALSVPFPQYSIKAIISPNLVWTGAPESGFFSTLAQFSAYLNEKSRHLLGGYDPNGDYLGVSIAVQNNTFLIYDGTTQTTPRQLVFTDLIGQPTWAQPNAVQVTCVLRGDINVGDYVTLPQAPGTVQSGSNSQWAPATPGNTYSTLRTKSIFQSTFRVDVVRHVGESRNADGTAWLTTLDLKQVKADPNAVPSLAQIYARRNFKFSLP